jgi:hypothetical protein
MFQACAMIAEGSEVVIDGPMVNDISWSADKKLHGWTLPQTARLLKLWGIRHIRWMWLTNQVYQAADRWAAMGIGFGGPNQYDRWVLYAIFRGWA